MSYSKILNHTLKTRKDFEVGIDFKISKHDDVKNITEELKQEILEEKRNDIIDLATSVIVHKIKNGLYNSGDYDTDYFDITYKLILNEKNEVEESLINGNEEVDCDFEVEVSWEVLETAKTKQGKFDVIISEDIDYQKEVEVDIDVKVDMSDDYLEENELYHLIDEENAYDEALSSVEDLVDQERHTFGDFVKTVDEIDYLVSWSY